MAKTQFRYRKAVPVKELFSGSTDHRRFAFFGEWRESERAAAVLGPYLKKQARLAIDFSQPRYCRVHEGKLTLIVKDALQANRLTQLKPRIVSKLEEEEIFVSSLEIKVVPTSDVERNFEKPVELPRIERRKSFAGAMSAAKRAAEAKTPELKALLTELSAALMPTTGLEDALVEEIEREERRTIDKLMTLKTREAVQQELEHLRLLLPSAAKASSDATLAGVRRRLLLKIEACEAKAFSDLREAERLQARLTELIATKARVREAPERAHEIARILFAPEPDADAESEPEPD